MSSECCNNSSFIRESCQVSGYSNNFEKARESTLINENQTSTSRSSQIEIPCSDRVCFDTIDCLAYVFANFHELPGTFLPPGTNISHLSKLAFQYSILRYAMMAFGALISTLTMNVKCRKVGLLDASRVYEDYCVDVLLDAALSLTPTEVLLDVCAFLYLKALRSDDTQGQDVYGKGWHRFQKSLGLKFEDIVHQTPLDVWNSSIYTRSSVSSEKLQKLDLVLSSWPCSCATKSSK